jgi:hypothetical protein
MGFLSYGRFDDMRGTVPDFTFKLLRGGSRFCGVALVLIGLFGLAVLVFLD